MKIICDWQNCKEVGKYRAPVERDNSKKFRLLCLEHIKIFNKNRFVFQRGIDNQSLFFLKTSATASKVDPVVAPEY